MKIDSHHHFWNPARGDYGWMEKSAVASLRRKVMPNHLMPHLQACGIEKTILVQAAPTLEETEFLLGVADATDFVAKVVGWINFENKEDLHQLQRLRQHEKFAGVRPMIQDIPDPDWMHRKDVQWAFAALIDLDLTFDALGFPIHLDLFQRLFESYPKLRAVIDHGMKPDIAKRQFQPWASKMQKLAATTPVFCKISGLVTEAETGCTAATLEPYIGHLVASFGASRLMWGSDWPVLELNGSYETWFRDCENMLLDETTRSEIFGRTAARFYGI